MVANDDCDGKAATHLNCFYMHMIFEQKYPKPAIVLCEKAVHNKKMLAFRGETKSIQGFLNC